MKVASLVTDSSKCLPDVHIAGLAEHDWNVAWRIQAYFIRGK